MNRRFLSLLVLLSCLLLAAAPADEARTWLRRGNTAFQHGDYQTAVAHYEKAERSTTDPGEVAFNLAAARYFLALSSGEGRNANLREAELLYRCCVDPQDPRHVQALYGLGTCLLQSAGPAGIEELNRAVDCLDRCLALGRDSELLARGRHNREVARFRLAQVQSSPDRNPDTPPNKERPRPDRADPRTQKIDSGEGSLQSGDTRSQKGGATPANPNPGEKPKQTEERQPGKGTGLPPVPDNDNLPPLSSRDATEHLEQAARRILEEEKAYRRQRARPPLAGVRDW